MNGMVPSPVITPVYGAQADAEVLQLKAEIAELKRQLEWFKRQLFGRKSEKRLDISPDQLELGELLAEPRSEPPEPVDESVRSASRKKRRNEGCVTDSGLRFDDTVPVEVIQVEAPELSGPDAEHFEVIGEKVTHRLAQRPGAYVVLEYRTPVLKDRRDQALSSPVMPAAVFEKSIADVSLLAGLLVDKFVYHIPLYRQHQRLANCGIQVSRATLTHWVRQAIGLLVPIEEAQLRHILMSKVLAMDETPIKAGRKHRGKMQSAWYWPIYGEDDEIVFTYSSSRGHEHIKVQLEGFEGVLLTDGYGAYDRYAANKPEITQAQCWAHTRRYFDRARESDPGAVDEALEMIGRLYGFEAHIREKAFDGEKALAYRARHSKPVVDAFFEWCHQQRQRPELINSHPLAKALVYVSNHQTQLSVYLSDPSVAIDTNHLERALRVIPMGRKNWMFCWTEVGAKHVGVIQGLLTTCRLQGIDPYTYLVDVLQRVSQHPAKLVEELTPRVWREKFADRPLISDLQGRGNNALV